MKDCVEVRDRFVEALYGELNPTLQGDFDEHVESCRDCALELARIRATLDFMSLRRRPDPGRAFWESFADRTQKAIGTPSGTDVPSVLPFKSRSRRSAKPSWWLNVAAAIGLIGFGVWIGKTVYLRQQAVPTAPIEVAGSDSDRSADELNRRVAQFMDRSKTMLLGIVNLDPDSEDIQRLDFRPQRRVSQHLIGERALFREELERSGDRRLAELVADLELILIQIANLESKYNLQGVEMIKDSVERSDILLKINLEQIRSAKKSHEKVAGKEI